jgi:UDP-glucose 4-epimerase
MAKILVTGGAGYIGSHTCMALASAGHQPVVFDNLRSGHRRYVKWGPLEEGDIRDRARVDAVIARHKPEAVIHFAGLIEVGQSVSDPAAFYDHNVRGSLVLLDAMRAAGVSRLVFSSTCAIFGAPTTNFLAEDHPVAPLNPYGRTKLMVEQASHDYAQAYGLRFANLRYFNAAGAAPHAGLGEWHEPETHALPLAILTALGQRPEFSVFGTDYPTRDGTCVRDYVHVLDLADAHVAAVDHLLSGRESISVNLGTGHGVTVKELVQAVGDANGEALAARLLGRRAGDPASLVADNRMAYEVLGWRPQRTFTDCVESALNWHRDVMPTIKSAESQCL